MTTKDAYPVNSRFKIASNGMQYLVVDNRTGKTVSWHNTYTGALKARDYLSASSTTAHLGNNQ